MGRRPELGGHIRWPGSGIDFEASGRPAGEVDTITPHVTRVRMDQRHYASSIARYSTTRYSFLLQLIQPSLGVSSLTCVTPPPLPTPLGAPARAIAPAATQVSMNGIRTHARYVFTTAHVTS